MKEKDTRTITIIIEKGEIKGVQGLPLDWNYTIKEIIEHR